MKKIIWPQPTTLLKKDSVTGIFQGILQRF